MRTFGLVLSGLLALADIGTLFAGGDFPPFEVAVAAAILGVVTLIAVVLGWRGHRGAVLTVVVTRVLSALAAVPAFFASDVPAAAQIVAAVFVALTALAVALLVPSLRKAG